LFSVLVFGEHVDTLVSAISARDFKDLYKESIANHQRTLGRPNKVQHGPLFTEVENYARTYRNLQTTLVVFGDGNEDNYTSYSSRMTAEKIGR
jgi:hypothetical protein